MPAPTITQLVYEDIATGKRKPITPALTRLAGIGSKPTVRADVGPGTVAVQWALTSNDKPVAAYPGWLDTNAPFRLVSGDKPLALPAGVYTVSATPIDAAGVVGKPVTATLSIAAWDVPGDETAKMGWGFAANGGDPLASMAVAMRRIKADGGQWVRLWSGLSGYIDGSTAAIITTAKALNLKVILTTQTTEHHDGEARVTQNFGKPDFRGWVDRNASILRKCEYVGAGSEWNLLNKYKPDDIAADWYKPYVDRFAGPLSDELGRIGVKMLLASVTESEQTDDYLRHAQALSKAGAAEVAHGADVHIYAYPNGKPNVTTIDKVAPTLKAYSAAIGLPLHITEAGLHKSAGRGAAYLAALPLHWQALAASGVVESAEHYRAFPSSNPGAGSNRPMFDAKGNPTDVYAAVKAAVA